MEYHICEICDLPIKGEINYLICGTSKEFAQKAGLFGNKREGIPEICKGCRKLVEDILKVRKQGIAALTERLKEIYKLPYSKKKKRK